MKLKEGSYNDITSNIKYHLIYPSTSSGFNSTTNIRRPNSQYEKFGNLKIKSDEPEPKNRKKFPNIFTSDPNNTANLYLNKNNFTFKKKNKPKKPYYEKEQLFERCLKLQSALNSLNLKNNKLKVENGKQSKEIEKQNKLLNMINVKNLKEKRSFSKPNINLYSLNKYKNSNLFLNLDEQEEEDKKNLIKQEYEAKYDIQSNDNSDKMSETNKKDINKYYKEKYKLPKDISYDNLKSLYNSLFNKFGQTVNNLNYLEKENAQLKKEIDQIKISNETLLSNLKMQCIYLEKENEAKKNEIEALKKSAKYSKFNELLNEKNIYEKEMKRMKSKLNDSLSKINSYKKLEEEMKTIYDLIKKKDFKIKILERQLTIFSNNSDETVQKLEEELIFKDKIIKKQEREIKFRNLNDNYYLILEKEKEKDEKLSQISGTQSNLNLKSFQQINKKHIELYQLYFEMKQKGINSPKYYINNVLKKLENSNSISDNKLLFIDSLLNLFNIEDMETKYLFINLANKEFANNKVLSNIKTNQIAILEALFNKKHKSDNELKQILTSNEETITKMKNLFEKYDPLKRGFVTFSDMIEIIKELKLDNVKEEILLYTKSEIFDKMNYSKLLLLAKGSSELEESIHQLNNKLANFVNTIKKDKNSLNDCISYLKENIIIKTSEKGPKEESSIEVIHVENLVKFFSIKNIKLDQQDIDLLKQLYGVDEILLGSQFPENSKYLNYIEYNKIVNKLGDILKNEASETNADTKKQSD